jgi:hypothetical protein
MVQDEWRNHKDDQSVARAQNRAAHTASSWALHIGLKPHLSCPDLKGVESGAAMEGSGREGGLGEARQRAEAGYFFSERNDHLA